MKKIKNFILCALFIIFCVNSNAQINFSKKINDRTFEFKCNLSNSVESSELTIIDSGKKIVYASDFKSDKNVENYKFVNSNKILELSRQNNSKLNKEDVGNLIT